MRLRNGKHVGTFVGDEVFALDGHYLGEIRNKNRLVVRKSSKSKTRSSASRKAKLVGQVNRVNLVGLVGLVGFEDLPDLS